MALAADQYVAAALVVVVYAGLWIVTIVGVAKWILRDNIDIYVSFYSILDKFVQSPHARCL
ncbi:hypothetical protein [Thermococcus piezophilus]|uniref:hypothetical protein n=1 Tax=Thermococcus piezophilus TaxID=1712654 RepID=UPI0019019A34|nr:hypothetical protein [Thermococcus piezophilus]